MPIGVTRMLLMAGAASIAGCVADLGTVDGTTERYLATATAQVSAAAARADLTTDETATVAAARRDGGSAAFSPLSAGGQGFVGWLDLPRTHACSAQLPADYYVVDAKVAPRSAVIGLRRIDGTAVLQGASVPVEHLPGSAPPAPMARIALGPDSFTLGRWFECSDGVGHCGWAITLDASTRGC